MDSLFADWKEGNDWMIIAHRNDNIPLESLEKIYHFPPALVWMRSKAMWQHQLLASPSVFSTKMQSLEKTLRKEFSSESRNQLPWSLLHQIWYPGWRDSGCLLLWMKTSLTMKQLQLFAIRNLLHVLYKKWFLLFHAGTEYIGYRVHLP